ncbi:unnamed protein product [Vitrella brassicaformis CCMP3155]|uniref:Uncharacterized protein n=1 Tax=Vitrella brassicaformis (strain CCMP3155) TaxID=1169540 RepID=A0A0G4FAU0_VITBC|nr:unnamed protein product [Vitrella brassicaformis CCMP3155]|eukprot:CEM09763.1 unnamed protein product [Vitrella brassicaformis CCMP3155]
MKRATFEGVIPSLPLTKLTRPGPSPPTRRRRLVRKRDPTLSHDARPQAGSRLAMAVGGGLLCRLKSRTTPQRERDTPSRGLLHVGRSHMEGFTSPRCRDTPSTIPSSSPPISSRVPTRGQTRRGLSRTPRGDEALTGAHLQGGGRITARRPGTAPSPKTTRRFADDIPTGVVSHRCNVLSRQGSSSSPSPIPEDTPRPPRPPARIPRVSQPIPPGLSQEQPLPAFNVRLPVRGTRYFEKRRERRVVVQAQEFQQEDETAIVKDTAPPPPPSSPSPAAVAAAGTEGGEHPQEAGEKERPLPALEAGVPAAEGQIDETLGSVFVTQMETPRLPDDKEQHQPPISTVDRPTLEPPEGLQVALEEPGADERREEDQKGRMAIDNESYAESSSPPFSIADVGYRLARLRPATRPVNTTWLLRVTKKLERGEIHPAGLRKALQPRRDESNFPLPSQFACFLPARVFARPSGWDIGAPHIPLEERLDTEEKRKQEIADRARGVGDNLPRDIDGTSAKPHSRVTFAVEKKEDSNDGDGATPQAASGSPASPQAPSLTPLVTPISRIFRRVHLLTAATSRFRASKQTIVSREDDALSQAPSVTEPSPCSSPKPAAPTHHQPEESETGSGSAAFVAGPYVPLTPGKRGAMANPPPSPNTTPCPPRASSPVSTEEEEQPKWVRRLIRQHRQLRRHIFGQLDGRRNGGQCVRRHTHEGYEDGPERTILEELSFLKRQRSLWDNGGSRAGRGHKAGAIGVRVTRWSNPA